ncbi:MAG: hypothetical protein H6983_26130 [Ectothiorhodospiraceae bacterium]|nr:hypothetical protein [Ectothiorhodospiraceae bacterium]
MRARDPLLRHSREAVGAFVLVAVVLFVLALTQASRVQEWLNPGIEVKVLMPEEGLYGLSAGADVEILGTSAGKIRDIVVRPNQRIHAVLNLRREILPFLREDSQAYIKRRFGVAGDAYLEITRGTAGPLDADYAVLEASGERIPTQTVEQLISEVRSRLLPILDQAEGAIGALADVATLLRDSQDDVRQFIASLRGISQRVERGEGTVGRLVTDATLVESLEAVLARTRDAMDTLAPVLAEVQSVARDAARMSARIGEQSAAIPAITAQAKATLGSLQAVMEDVRRTTPELPRLARNVNRSTEALPLLLDQSQQTLAELEALLVQLRGSWLLGGSGGAREPAPTRISPLEVTP